MDRYWIIDDHIEIWLSKLWLCQYYCVQAPPGLKWNTHKNAKCCFEQTLETAAVRLLTSHKRKMNKI